jgi:hypothetical protein
MRNKLMIATAVLALTAGTSAALAQQESPRGAPAEKMAPKAGPAPSRAVGAPNGAAEKVEPNRPQAQQNREQNRGKSETTAQAPSERRDQGRDNERRGDREQSRSKSQTTGQAPSEHREQGRDNERREQNRSSEDNKRLDQNRTDIDKSRSEERGNVRDERRETTGQGAGAGAGRGISVNITPEHRTQIHDIITKERSAPRMDHVDFGVSVGTVVPRSVRLVSVPRQIIEIEPEWRGFEYFMIGDQIVIVNPRSMEIVAVIDV